MESLIILAGIAFTANKIISVLKGLLNRDWNIAVTQGAVWLASTVVVFLTAGADLTSGYTVPGTSSAFGDLDALSLVLVGLMAGSSGSFAYDFKKAFDNTDSSTEPRLLGKLKPVRQDKS